SAAFREFVWAFVNQIAKGLVLLGRTPSYPMLKQYSADVEPLFIDVMELLYQRHNHDYRPRLAEYEAALLMPAEKRRDAGFNFVIPRAMNDRGQRGKAFWLLFREVGEQLPLTPTERDVALSMMKAFQTDASYMAKLVASLDPFLEKMTTGAVSRLIAPDFTDLNRDVFSWSQIIQARGIVYIGLDALSDAEVAATVGNSMFADLTSVAGRLYKHGADHGLPAYPKTGYQPKICLHADEFNELAGPEFVPMLNKAGGAGVQVTAYTQTLPDIEARVGSKSKAEQMLGNFNTVVMLRVLNESTARLLVEKTNKVNVSDIATFSGSSDNPDITSSVRFHASTQSREVSQSVELLRTSDLAKLPKGQAFALLDGNNLYKLRIPLLRYNTREAVPDDIDAVAREMEKNYSNSPTNTDWARYQEYLREDEIFADGEYGSMQDLCNSYLRELDSDAFMQQQTALMDGD
ncbi:TraM recognition domain-containing protein, partial [uncultured Cardiobacterium sp.]|uniref:TraM recognition domain-containing protein n=1 Tax=uncultured Cardiobacterium sp. TaxID=417619 RepID=UPI0026364E76